MNYYDILGVSRKASHDDIARAFKVLAKEYHPDVNKSANAQTKFIEIYEAYSILKDNEKRLNYDKIVFATYEEAKNNEDRKDAYSDWRETARKEAKYYSEAKYQDFAERVLKNIKVFAKTTKVILGFFGAMILCGLVSKFIIGPILTAQIAQAIQNSNQRSLENNGKNSTVSSANQDENKNKTLPLPLAFPVEGWERIYISDDIIIDMPPTMEIQGGVYKEIIDPVRKAMIEGYLSNVENNINKIDFPDIMGIDGNEFQQAIIDEIKDNKGKWVEIADSKVTMQQKGLNDITQSGFQKYARVMIGIEYGNAGDYESLVFDINEITAEDIRELDKLYKTSAMVMNQSGTGLKLVEWFPFRLEVVNGMSCLHTSYTRQLNDDPLVFVNIYYFHNSDRMYSLTFSYRLSESEYWKDDFEKMLKTFRVLNPKGMK